MTTKDEIRLGQYMKRIGLVGTGGEAKYLIQSGQVQVNGQVETRRRRRLAPGDVIALAGQKIVVRGPTPDTDPE